MQDLKHTDITYLPGIGPARAKVLREELNIHTWHDLLYYFPFKHIDRSRLYKISELSTDMPFVQVRGQFLSFEEMGVGRKRHLVGHFTDGEMVMDLVWFARFQYITRSIKLHTDYIIFGRPAMFNGRINISHPDVDPADTLLLSKMRMQPYYSLTEKMRWKYSLQTEQIRTLLLLQTSPVTTLRAQSLLKRICECFSNSSRLLISRLKLFKRSRA